MTTTHADDGADRKTTTANSSSVDLLFRRLVSAAVGVYLAQWWITYTVNYVDTRTLFIPTIVVSTAALALSVACVRMTPSPLLILSIGGICLIFVCWAALDPGTAGTRALARDGSFFLLMPSLAAWTLFSTRTIVALGVPLGTIAVTSGLLSSIDTPIAIENGLFTATTMFVARGMANVFRQRAVIADRLESDLSAQIARTQANRARGIRDRATARAIHDEVLDALAVIAMAGQSLPVAEVSQRCRSSLDKVDQPVSSIDGVPQTDLVSEIVRAVNVFSGRLKIKLEIPDSLERPTLPAIAVRAIAMATLEALRNVEKHAQTKHVDVAVRCRSTEQGELIVRDRGVGFRSTDVRRDKLGISQSILARLREEGIDAHVRSAPSIGTVVVFSWRKSVLLARQLTANTADTDVEIETWDTSVFPNTRRIVTTIYLLPLFFSVLTTFIWHFSDMRYPSLALAALSVEIGLAGVCVQAVASLRLNRRASTWLFAVDVMSIIIGLLAVRPGTADGYAFWAAGGGAPGIATISLLRPIRESTLVATIATSAIIACFGLFFHSTLPTAAGPAGVTMAAYILGATHRRAIDRLVVLTDGLIRETRDAISLEQTIRAEREVDSIRLEHVRRAVVPFLRAIVNGQINPTVEPVHRQALALAQQVRLRLIVPLPFRNDPDFARACDEATTRGIEITLDVGSAETRDVHPQALELLTVVVADPMVKSVRLSIDTAQQGDNGSAAAMIRGRGSLVELGAALSQLCAEVDMLEHSIMARVTF